MEENQDNLKNLAAKENKEVSNAIVDENTKEIIDVEELLQGQDPVASKLNNLMKIGVSIEQIKNVYELSGGTQPGITLDAALEELNKVFYILARGINESPNALMVDLITGAIDFEATRQKEIELGDVDEYITSSYVMKEKDEFLLADALNMMLGKDNIEQTKLFAEIDAELYSSIEGWFTEQGINLDFSKEEIDSLAKILGISPEELKRDFIGGCENIIDAGALFTHTENDVHDAIAKYMRYSLEERPEVNINKSLEDIKKAIEACPEEERKKFQKYILPDGSLDVENMSMDEYEYMHVRNVGAVAVRLLSFISNGANFNDMDQHSQEKLLISLARAARHTDNAVLQKNAAIIAKAIGIEFSFKGIREKLNTIVDRNLKTDRELISLSLRGELNPYTAEIKYAEIRDNLNQNIGVAPEGIKKARVKARAIQEYDAKEKRVLAAVHKIGTKINKSGNDFRGYEIAILFQKMYDKDKSSIETLALAKYIENNQKFFEDFFRDKENYSIFNNDGSVSITRIERAVEGVILERESEKNIKYMERALEASDKAFKGIKNKKLVEEIKKEAAKDPTYLKGTTRDKIINLVNILDVIALSDEEFKELSTIDPKITETLEKRKEEAIEKLNKINYDRKMRMDNKTKDDALKETALLLEARIISAKGTALYGKYTSERDAFYRNNPEAQRYRDEIRDKDGNITTYGKEMIDDYVVGYQRRKMSNHLKKIVSKEIDTPEERVNFSKWLIVALSSGSYKVQQEAIQKVKKVFPEFYANHNTEPSIEEVKEQLFKEAYGEKIDPTKQKEIEGKLKKNFTKIVLRESILITGEKLTDKNVDIFFDKHAEIFDASRTDLSISELQNNFENSQIEYSENDDRDLDWLYKASTINSWISNKEDADKLSFLALHTIMENSKFGNDKTENDEKAMKFLKENEALGNKLFDEDGKVDTLDKMKTALYIDNKMTSEILKGFSRKIFSQNKKFENMTKGEQRDVIRQIELAIGHLQVTPDPLARKVLSKLTYRAAEMLNTDERTVFEYDEDNNPVINQDEFNRVVRRVDKKAIVRSGSVYLDAAEKYDAYRKAFFTEKANSYIRKGEEDFYELQSENNNDKLMEIEQLKVAQQEKYQTSGEEDLKIETQSEAKIKKMYMLAKGGTLAKSMKGTFRARRGPEVRPENTKIDADGVKIYSRDDNDKNEIKVRLSRTVKSKKAEVKKQITTADTTYSRDDNADQTVNTQENVVKNNNVSPLMAEDVNTDAIPNDYEIEMQEDKGIKAFFKNLLKKFNTKGLPSRNEETKKSGFFARLFNKKEKNEEITPPPVVHEDKKVPNGLDHVVLDNSDGKYNYSTSGTNKAQDAGKVSEQKNQDEIGEIS